MMNKVEKSSHCVSLSSHISKFSIIIDFFLLLISFLRFDLSFFCFSESIRRKGKRKLASTVGDDGNAMNFDSISFDYCSHCEIVFKFLF